MGIRLRSSFLNGDWDSFDQAAEFLSERDSLSFGKAMRIFLAKRRNHNSMPLRAFQHLLRLQHSRRMRRLSGGSFSTLEGIVRSYSSSSFGRTE